MTTQYNGTIWNELHSIGLNDTAAAGVMGNMSQESSMNPGEAGGGLMQWIGSRWDGLVNYANSKGESPSSVDAQVGWFGQELQAGNEGITLQGLNSQSSPAAAALYVSQNYERPAAWAANNANREKQANNFYNQYSGKTVPSGGSDGSITPTNTSTTPSGGSTPFARETDIIDEINNSMNLQNFSILHPGESLAQNAGAIALRTVFVLLGLILVIFALVAVVEKTTGGAVPVPV